MPRNVVPSPLRWLIGVELARHRNAAGMTLAGAERLSGIPKPSISHLESGRMQQDPDHIGRLLLAYQTGQAEIDRLTSLTGRADEATWWAPWALIVPDWFKTFVGLEGLAAEEFVYEPTIIPGLLQIEGYARAVTAGSPRVRQDHGERFVGFRMARAARLTDAERPLRLHAVVAEAALRLAVGTPELRRDQLRHLLVMAELDGVTIQIVRPEDGLHPALTGHFAVLGFGNTRSLAYAELPDGAVYLQDPDQVETYTMTAETLQRVALGPDQSAALVASMIGD
ncbi:MAG: helix-turn-helix domain-containing protein [Actinomycetota bacterium]|nr:helix-turn-helix domain-containing protein [Actinomycetota bacterium]